MRWRILASLAGVTLLLGVPAVAPGGFAPVWFQPGHSSGNPRTLGVGESARQGPLTLTLANISFSGTRTIIVMDVSNDLVQVPTERSPAFLDVASIQLSGVNPTRGVRVLGFGRPDAKTVRYRLEAGPATTGDAPVTVTVQRAFLRDADGLSTIAEGPWKFEAIPGSAALDPKARVVPVLQSVQADGISITLRELRLSSDETVLAYELQAPPAFLGPPSAPARIYFEDGSFIHGVPVEQPHGQGGVQLISFPPLPDSTQNITVDFGSYLLRTEGSDLSIGLPGVASLGEQITLSQRLPTPGGDIVAQSLRTAADSFAVELGPEQAGVPGLTASPHAHLEAVDNFGHSYPIATRGVLFGKNASGRAFFEREVLSFTEPLDPRATQLSLKVSEFARLVSGPWQFSLAVSP